MKCLECGTQNPIDSKFCRECATPLPHDEDKAATVTRTISDSIRRLDTGALFAGRYRIVEELGAGGMGRVYRALDTHIDEEIVIKLIRPEIASNEEIIARFRNELKLARGIVHRNVARMFDINEDRGVHFITMEYVRGEDLKKLIRKMGRLSPTQTVSIAAQICRGLAEAHRKGVVHRDLKPQNVLVDNEGTARIVDFGIARSSKTESITATGSAIGSPHYMSPEQGEGVSVDHRTDIYSLGVLLFEMSTGRLPFLGNTPLSIAMKHKSEPPPDPRTVNPDIPESLALVILGCLAKVPEARPQSASELLEQLSSIQGVLTSSGTSLDKAHIKDVKKPFSKPVKRVLAVTILLLLTAAAYRLLRPVLSSAGEETAEAQATSGWKNSIAVLPFRDLSPEKNMEHICFGMTEAINDRLAEIEALKVTSTSSVMRYRDSGKDNATIGRELGIANLMEGSVQVEGGSLRVRGRLIDTETDTVLWTDTFEGSLQGIFQLQDDVSEQIAGALRMELVSDSSAESGTKAPPAFDAYEFYLRGMNHFSGTYLVTLDPKDFETSVALFQKALEIAPDYAEAYGGLSWIHTVNYIGLGNPDDQRKAVEYAKQAYRLNPRSALANALYGSTYMISGEYDKTYSYLRTALELNPNQFEVQFTAAVFSRWMGLCHQAVMHFGKAAELDPFSAFSVGGLGVSLAYLGQFEEAVQKLDRNLEIQPIPNTLQLLTEIFLFIGEEKRAVDLMARAERDMPDHPGLQVTRALILALRGEKEKALEISQRYSVYLLLGMKEEALDAMEGMISRSRTELPYLMLIHIPAFDILRDDPRFEALVAGQKNVYEQRLRKFGDL